MYVHQRVCFECIAEIKSILWRLADELRENPYTATNTLRGTDPVGVWLREYGVNGKNMQISWKNKSL